MPNKQKHAAFKYRKDIDGLRSIAVLLVLIFHFQLSPFGKGGFLGVDIFFVISGFLITSIILKQLNAERFSFNNFYAKRVRRLAPSLFATLSLVLVAGYFLLLPADYIDVAKQILVTQFYGSNIFFWQNVNYFGLHADTIPLLHTWSLAVEEQFYLFYPAIIYLIYRCKNNLFWQFIALLSLLSFLLNLFFIIKKPEATFYLLPTRGWELLLGGLSVFWLEKYSSKNKTINELIGLTGIIVIFISVLCYTEQIRFPGYYALLPTIATMCIIVSGGSYHTIISKVLSIKPLVYIGKLSYPLYLVHWPVHIFASSILGEDYTMIWRIGMFISTFIISFFILHIVENPIRKSTFFSRNKNIYNYYLSGLALTVICSVYIIFSGGVPSRFSPETVLMAEYSNDRPPAMSECLAKNKSSYDINDFCKIGNTSPKGIKAEWLIVGDSHAWATKEAFSQWLEKKGEAGLFLFLHSCPPLKDIDLFKSKGECLNFNKNIYSFMSENLNIKNIVLISTWIQAKEGLLTKDANTKLNTQESLQLFNEHFDMSIDYLANLETKIYIWCPVPGAKGNVPKILAKSSGKIIAEDKLQHTTVEHYKMFSFFYKSLERNENYIYKAFSPAEALCSSSNKCDITINGRPVYYDNAHLAYSLSDYWALILRQQENNLKLRTVVDTYNNVLNFEPKLSADP